MSIDELVVAHGEQLAVHGVQIRRINLVLGIAESSLPPVVCPGCRKPVVPVGDGSLPPHQINGAVLRGQRRSAPVCRYQAEAVA